METYSLLREFADSWMLLALFSFFVAMFVWAWRPGSRAVHDAAAQSIFRHDVAPLQSVPAPTPEQEG